MLKETIKARIKLFEQSNKVALKPYLCPKKKWTIGWGYNYQDRGFTRPILRDILVNIFGPQVLGGMLDTQYTTEMLTGLLARGFTAEIADKLLDIDVDSTLRACSAYRGFDGLDDVRKATVADMHYQMGDRKFSGFKKMLMGMSTGNYERMAAEAMNSKWYAESGNRSKINVAQLKTGEWHTVKEGKICKQ